MMQMQEKTQNLEATLREMSLEDLQQLRALIDAEIARRRAQDQKKIRVVIPSWMLGDWRKGTVKPFARVVRSIDRSQRGGFALIGEFVPTDREIEINEGSILVVADAAGSWKHKQTVLWIFRVREGSQFRYKERSTPIANLEYVADYDVPQNWLSVYDKLDELLSSKT